MLVILKPLKIKVIAIPGKSGANRALLPEVRNAPPE
jgi:hypothetical protein